MHDEELVTFEAVEQATRPGKKMYTATPTGLNALRNWLAEPTDTPPIRDPFLVKVFAGYTTDKKVMLEQAGAKQLHHQENLATYQEIADRMDNRPTLTPAQLFARAALEEGVAYFASRRGEVANLAISRCRDLSSPE